MDIPDLFTLSEPVEKTPVAPIIIEKPQNLSFAEGNQKKTPEVEPEKLPPAEVKKNIEKMVILYTDKTFSTYFPET